MPFFKRREHEVPQPTFNPGLHQQFHTQTQPGAAWTAQPSAIKQHHISELRELHLRMQKLQMQMDQITASVQAKRASAPASHTQHHQPSAVDPAIASACATGPGPCPFPPFADTQRFEELDDTESHEHGRTRTSSNPPFRPAQAQTAQELDLEQLLRDGNMARARSASPAMGHTPSPPSQFQSHGQPPAVDPFAVPQAAPMSQHGMPRFFGHSPPQMPPMADTVPRQTSDPFQAMSGMPSAAFPGVQPNGAFGNEYSPMQGIRIAHTSNPGVAPMYSAQSPGMSGFATSGQAMHGQHNAGYQFPNPFSLEQGPHRPGFGNGFSMQQLPSMLGQIGAQFQMPKHVPGMGRPASPRAGFGF